MTSHSHHLYWLYCPHHMKAGFCLPYLNEGTLTSSAVRQEQRWFILTISRCTFLMFERVEVFPWPGLSVFNSSKHLAGTVALYLSQILASLRRLSASPRRRGPVPSSPPSLRKLARSSLAGPGGPWRSCHAQSPGSSQSRPVQEPGPGTA